MKFRTKNRNTIKSLLGNIHEWKQLVLMLSCIVVFVTTYMLILPAFTLDKEEAAEQGGIDVPVSMDSVDFELTSQESSAVETEKESPEAFEENAEEAITEEATEAATEDEESSAEEDAVSADSFYVKESVKESSDNSDADAAKPADSKAADSSQTREADLSDTEVTESAEVIEEAEVLEEEETDDNTDMPSEVTLQNDESDDFVVSVEGKDAGLSEDMIIRVREIDQSTRKQKKEYDSLYGDALEAVQNEESLETSSDFEFAKFYDISIMNGKEEVEPDAAVDVKISFGKKLQKELKAADPDRVHIIHFAEDKQSGEVTPEVLDADTTDITVENGKVTEAAFTADSFSVFAVVYTVDFHHDVNGKTYDFSIPGGGFISFYDLVKTLGIETDDFDTGKDEIKELVDGVESIEFSDTDLVSVSKAEEDTTVGAIKEHLDLECEYSAELTDAQIAEINEQTVDSGDWALISLKPFDTEESLTVTMKNGDVWTVKVTDAHEIPDSTSGTIDVTKSYLICYEADGTYYLLKNDGSTDSSHTPKNFESLNSTYCWTFNFVFEEKDRPDSLTYNYYLIRPIDNKMKTIALNAEGEPLLQQSNNNVAVVPAADGGFRLIGYNDVKLNFADGGFSAKKSTEQNPFDGIVVHVYEMDSLPTYDYTVRSADETRGTVTVQGGTQRTETHDGAGDTHYYDATSSADKYNAGRITAVPVNHKNTALRPGQAGYGQNKWEFDHWEQDGTPLDRDQYPATINAETLPIPFNGSNLTAYFRQNSSYVVPDSEKEASSIADMTDWFDGLTTKSIPLNNSATSKTAEVYDYENRIYRVDLTSKANFETFNGNIDMAFCLDVSNSMKFPSKLVKARTNYNNNTNPIPIYQINNSGWQGNNKGWLDTSRGYNNPYYLIADATDTATVFRIYYQNGSWKAQDASRETEGDKSFVIGNSFSTTWAGSGTHPFGAGDNDNTTYTIYNAGDNGRNRFYYLNQTLNSTTTDLQTIMNLLAVAGDDSPDVRVAYNTFNKNLGSQRSDFALASPLSVDFSYSANGGTRPDQAFNDAAGFSWTAEYNAQTGDTDRYVVLITDGAPQGKRDGEGNNVNYVETARTAANNLKTNSHVKLITIGLSMENVTSGKQLLYDIADTDKDGNKMFYLAESASDLPNIMRQIIKTIMADATVFADVTDTVGDAFYPVDKTTGLPLSAGNMIDIEGRKTTDADKAAGVVQADGKTIKWVHQSIDQANGWHGTVYVKAKEDLIGGNAVKTNSEAEIKATSYKVSGTEKTFDESLIVDKLTSLKIDPPSPRVNVNELQFNNADTEWTVYLGTEVDPKEQIRKLYENIHVDEVVNEDGSLHYSLVPNSITDDRDGDVSGTQQTFAVAPVILEMIKADNALRGKYIKNNELDWDAFMTDALKSDGITVPYHPYGIEGEDSRIVISITKTIQDGEETDLVNRSPHPTAVVNDEDEIEKYVLTVKYYPDYDHVLPAGQGGWGTESYHTGTYGTMYQGHSAGNETSENTHIINCFAKKLEIRKTDQSGNMITADTATFVLYRKATDDELEDDSVEKVNLNGVAGDYVAVQTLTTDEGCVTTETLPLLSDDEPYYLVETRAPAGYMMLAEPLKLTVDMTGYNTWTRLSDNSTSQTKPDPYELSNWQQEAAIKLWNPDGTAYDPAYTPVYDHINDTTSASTSYKIINNSGYELPHTGGAGTKMMYIIGALLTIIGGAGLVIRRRTRSA